MSWTDHTGSTGEAQWVTAEETLVGALGLTDPRDADDAVVHLDRHRGGIDELLAGRGRWAVLKSESLRGWFWGPLGFVGPMGAIALGIGATAAWLFALSYPSFVVWTITAYVALRLAVVKPDHRDWLAQGTPLGAGVVAAWAIRRHGESSRPEWDRHLKGALIRSPEYWHDLAGRAVAQLPMPRREKLVLEAFSARPDDLWHLLPLAPTDGVVRAALSRGPRSSATADFHAFQTLIRQADVRPVLEAIRAGAGNRDVLIRAVAASGNPAAVDLLLATLAERSDRLRSVARDGLVAMGPAVLPQLFSAFDLDNSRVQQGVARVLRGLGPSAEIEAFAARALRGELDETAASELRRIVLTRRMLSSELKFRPGDEAKIDEILASIPAPAVELPQLQWRSGAPLTEAAQKVLANLAMTESPEQRCAELAGIRPLLDGDSRAALMAVAGDSEYPVYRMVLADDAELLNHHASASESRQGAEEWVDVLERHASLAAVHALDDLWRTGVDGVVQTSAMAALMRISGQYDGLELFADQLLREVLADPNHPLFPSFSAGQFRRFEQMMISARRLNEATFRQLFRTIPAQHVLWGTYDGDGNLRGTFRLDEDYAAVDWNDDPFDFDPHVRVGVVHPAEMGPQSSRAWAEVFADYELVPHFEQLQRTACRLDESQARESLYAGFGDLAPGGVLEAALIQRGWRPSPMDIETVFTLTKPVQRGRAAFTAVIELEPGLGEDLDIPQRIESLAFSEGHHHVLSSVVTKVRLGEVDAVIFSEIVLELKDVLATTSSGEERSLPSIPTRLD